MATRYGIFLGLPVHPKRHKEQELQLQELAFAAA
jgi:hypothetical protein